MPAEATVREWALDDHAGFAARFARANMIGVAGLKDEILEISDDGSNDTYVDADGRVRTDVDVVQRSRLRVDTRKWLLAKLLPREFGDKVELTHNVNSSIATALTEVRRRTTLLTSDGPIIDAETEFAMVASDDAER